MLMVENIGNYRQYATNREYETGIFDKGNNQEESPMKEDWSRGQGSFLAMHTHRELKEQKEYQDKKWKYKKTLERKQAYMGQVLGCNRASNIDLGKRNSKRDSHGLD
eukprot:16429696-Heterocapsa_arctica.AAC.1